LSCLNSFLMEPSSTEAFKPAFPRGQIGYPLDGPAYRNEVRRSHSRKSARVTDPKPRYALLSQI
jgi:hypothetical protein